MEITITPFFAKILLKLNPLKRVLIMCKGYNEDYTNFTELVWQDDKDLDFFNNKDYPQFQIWLV